MSKSEAKVYYYADGESAIGPFTLEKLKQLQSAGVVDQDVQVGLEGSNDWKPLEAYEREGSEAPHVATPSLPSVKEPVQKPNFWRRYVEPWPNAFIIAVVLLLSCFWLLGWSADVLAAGGFDWHLRLANAFVYLLVLGLALVAIKAVRGARKLRPLQATWTKVGMGVLLGLLYVMCLYGVVFVIELFSAYFAYNNKQDYASVAPEQFRVSIIENKPVPVLGEDALVLRDLSMWVALNPGARSEAVVTQQAERSISPPVEELLIRLIYYDRYPGYETDRLLAEHLQELAYLYGFSSWMELEHFMATGEEGYRF